MKILITDNINPETTANTPTMQLECNLEETATILATFAECICRGNPEKTQLLIFAISMTNDTDKIDEMIKKTGCPDNMRNVFIEMIRARNLSRR